MITVAPATHTFGTVHTERNGQGTLFLANPTFADAEWSLSHIPEPPSKKRQTHSPGLAGRGAGVGRAPSPAGLPGGVNAAPAFSGQSGGRGGGSRRRSRDRAGGGVVAQKGESHNNNSSRSGKLTNSLTVDDPSVFVFSEKGGVIAGVKLPLKSSAACLPEDWNRLEVRVGVLK